MIELHPVPHELYMYIEELKFYGTIDRHCERYPTVLWLNSNWEPDILSGVMGVKKVREPIYKYKQEV
jgi:hypothetical protein